MPSPNYFPFRKVHPQGPPRLRLFCFPYAGGGASLYRQWTSQLAPAIEVCAVELPGRGVRLTEAPIPDMAAMCDDLAAAIQPLCDGTRIAMFGHSMGARIAFELARRFEDHVVHLFASGSPAPGTKWRHALNDTRPTSQLTDAEFKQRLRDLGGTPTEILDHDELMARMLPIVRADFLLTEGYRVEPRSRVTCPITIFAGVDDDTAAPPAAIAWEHCTTSASRMVEIAGAHFYLDTHRAQLLREIVRDLAAY